MEHVFVHGTYDAWHREAKRLLEHGTPPDGVQWSDGRDAQLRLADLSVTSEMSASTEPSASARRSVPRTFVERARYAACHREAHRFTLLYRILWRLTHGERELLRNPLDRDVQSLERLATEVRRDEHHMHAFVRFRELRLPDGTSRFVAWHRPDHYVVRLAAPFFVERFRSMRWDILSPDECAHWDGEALTFSAGIDTPGDIEADALEQMWRTYYSAIFNPARVNPAALRRQLPLRHWSTLPEASVIPELLRDAGTRVESMLGGTGRAPSARPYVPADAASLVEIGRAAAACRGCALADHATRTVFGEGPEGARLMLVGEQPGDEEDLVGRPFVGPAGEMLDRALRQAGIERSTVYVTNAVKHFTFRREGKRRIHERPRISDVRACRPWLETEIAAVRPQVIVCMGATAAQTLLGPQVRIGRDRGRALTSHWAPHVLLTYHPSAILRARDDRESAQMLLALVSDLRQASALIADPQEQDTLRQHVASG